MVRYKRRVRFVVCKDRVFKWIFVNRCFFICSFVLVFFLVEEVCWDFDLVFVVCLFVVCRLLVVVWFLLVVVDGLLEVCWFIILDSFFMGFNR